MYPYCSSAVVLFWLYFCTERFCFAEHAVSFSSNIIKQFFVFRLSPLHLSRETSSLGHQDQILRSFYCRTNQMYYCSSAWMGWEMIRMIENSIVYREILRVLKHLPLNLKVKYIFPCQQLQFQYRFYILTVAIRVLLLCHMIGSWKLQRYTRTHAIPVRERTISYYTV